MSKLVIWHEYQLGDGTVHDLAQIEQPWRQATLESDVQVPVAIAFISGILAGLFLAVALIWWVKLPFWPTCPAALLGATSIAWFWSIAESRSSMYKTEQISVIAPPSPAPFVPSVPLLANIGESQAAVRTTQKQANREHKQAHLVDFVRNCKIVGTSESSQNIKPSDRAQYLADRDTLLALGLAQWRKPDNKRLGWDLSVTPAQAVVLIRKHVIER